MLPIAAALLVASFLLSALLTALTRRAAPRLGLIDRPGAHKQHGREVALGGGVAMFATIAAFVAAAAIATAGLRLAGSAGPAWLPGIARAHLPGLAARSTDAIVLLAGAAILTLAGLVDDRRPMAAWAKLLVQVCVAVAVVLLIQPRLGPTGEPLNPLRIATFLPAGVSVAVTVLWIVTVTNAFNFLDNMDGLAGGVAAICAAVLAAAGAVNGQLFVPAMLLVIVGSAGGFLVFNFPPAKIFMGDAGSQMLGYWLAVLTVLTTYTRQLEANPAAMFMPLAILAVPLYDLVSVCVVRMAQGRRIMVGDRSHFSHRLAGRGMSTRAAVLTIYLATLATGLAAVYLLGAPLWQAWLVFAQTLCVLGIIALLEYRWDRRGG